MNEMMDKLSAVELARDIIASRAEWYMTEAKRLNCNEYYWAAQAYKSSLDMIDYALNGRRDLVETFDMCDND